MTDSAIWQIVLIITGLGQMIVTLAAVVTIIRQGKERAATPDRLQNERIAKLEDRIDKIEMHLDNDNKRLREIEEANHVVLQALLAIIGYSLDGTDNEKLRNAKTELEAYLIRRK